MKDFKKVKKKNSNGITLIALVITIIVLLILAGVSIATLTGDNGILAKAKLAKEENERAEKEEIWKLGALDSKIDEIVTGEVKASPVNDSDPGVLKGTGTQADPFLIESIEDLEAFSKSSNDINNSDRSFYGKYIKLKQTLDFNSNQSYASEKSLQEGGLKDQLTKLEAYQGFPIISSNITINSENKPEGMFLGNFDGNNCTLKNIKIKSVAVGATPFAGAGVFGLVGGNVSNLNIIGDISLDVINQQTALGGLAAANGGTIQNCTAKVQITGTDNGADNAVLVGGAIGLNAGTGTVTGVTSIPNISANNIRLVGGIAGQNDGMMQNCKVQGNITVENTDKSSMSVGGIVGLNSNTGIVKLSNSKIKMTTTNLETDANIIPGGAIGRNDGTATKLIADNDILAINCRYSGGIVGNNSNKVLNCKSQGNMTVTNENQTWVPVGGITGANSGVVINNINTCTLDVANSDTAESTLQIAAGGIVGTDENSTNKIVANNYNKGAIISTRNNAGKVSCGGIVANTSANIKYCYFNGSFENNADTRPRYIVSWASGGNIENCKYKKTANALETPIGGNGFTSNNVIEDKELTDSTVLSALNDYVEESKNPELLKWDSI